MPRYGFFDVGSNSVLALVVEVEGDVGRILYDGCIVSGLGRGLSAAGLDPESRQRTFDAIARHLAAVEELDPAPTWRAVATSAMRDAADGAAFAEELRHRLGLDVEIISGEREAELTWAATCASFPQGGPLQVVDIGGGSTEIILGEGGAIRQRLSLDIGSVRLTGRCLRGDPPSAESVAQLRREIAAALEAAPRPPAGALGVGSGSTVTTILAWRDAVEPYDAARVHGALLERRDVARAVAELSALTTAERARLPGIPAARAEVIVAGAAILEGYMSYAGLASLRVSDRGLRFGLLADTLPGVRIP